MRINAWYGCFFQCFRERPEPALGLPLGRVFAPNCLVPVTRHDTNEDVRPAGNDNLVHERPICSAYRLGEWENRIFHRPEIQGM